LHARLEEVSLSPTSDERRATSDDRRATTDDRRPTTEC
jgi:hypothetical protein